ncbi:hypothetical protein sos41_01950 [Alphaproteobacteria bacterium SO-S41]|nr:hypothetical protein sos41_01950 [Alphaproteobacteria bacterium SO-S41]
MGVLRKITVEVDAALLESAQKFTGEGITETVRKALEEINRKAAYAAAIALRGKVDLGIDWKQLKEDRE